MRGKRLLAGLGLSLVVVLGGVVAAPAAYADPVGPVLAARNAIAGAYVVMLADHDRDPASLTARYGGTVTREYDSAVHGFAARMTPGQAARMAADPAVKYVQQDGRVALTGAQVPAPSWGLDRIDQRALPLGGWYTYPELPTSTVHAYVIDTGIRTTHIEFGTRATDGYDFVDNDAVANDCNGHGTHVAGTIGGTTYGVAKEVQLVGVRVLDCTGWGSYSQIIAGVDWVTANAVKPAVANMSLAGPADQALDDAVRASIASGVTYVVAAGNSNVNACTVSPADTPEAITVAASDSNDVRASFSDWGPCVDLFAPGVNIASAYGSGDTAMAWMSGTSMASPHVAGLAAMVLSAHPTWTPAQVSQAVLDASTVGRIAQAGSGTPNRLEYLGGGPAEPAAVAASPCWQGYNGTRVGVRDRGTGYSGIRISCAGKASRAGTVVMTLAGGRRGDYQVDLVAPGGHAYRIKSASSRDNASGLSGVFRVDLSAANRSGDWTLRIRDTRRGNSGTLLAWSVSL
jgi:subtilisin family serine protease